MKTFHSGCNWVGFPHLSDNEDGEVGNNPDPVEDIFIQLRIMLVQLKLQVTYHK